MIINGNSSFQWGQSQAGANPQTMAVASIAAGTTDKAGANWTLNGSRGTGLGAGGAIYFQTAPAGTVSGSAQNALATAMTILGSGNVGIGTTGPNDKLDVYGGVAIGTGYAGAAGVTAPTNGAIIQGNVGIGTTAPIGSMHIYNPAGGAYSATTIADATLVVENYLSDGNSTYSELSFRPHGTSSQGRAAISAIQDTNARADTDLTFKIDNNNTGIAEAMRINLFGTMGIGTATMSSSNKLEVNGAASIGYPDLYGGSAGGLMSVSGRQYPLIFYMWARLRRSAPSWNCKRLPAPAPWRQAPAQ
jgi:hypothetical protein